MKAALVLMAAGLGSRYGGCKQLDGVGPNGEILMEYSVYDALAAGFTKLVFVIKDEMRGWMEEFCRSRIAKNADIRYAVQGLEGACPGRTKPLGTVHALLCARAQVDEPFAVVNADDFYGADAFRTMYRGLSKLDPSGKEGLIAAYRLKNTVSRNGTVTRGICERSGEKLLSVRETYRIGYLPDGRIADTENGVILDPETLVSMNLWGFSPEIFAPLRTEFDLFLEKTGGGRGNEEFPLPSFVDRLLSDGRLSVGILPTEESWFGVTYREDKPLVAEKLSELHRSGAYPKRLNEVLG
ncbi:MAG: hypothetical protein PUA83_02770 [Clostridiales bacterium]|nr:hypothetical protein [Clostridiales bacterium]